MKNLVQSGRDTFKSILPSNTDKSDNTDSKRKTSSGSIDHPSTTAESSSFIDQIKNKFKRSSSSTEQEKESQPYDRLWQASSQQEGRSGENAPNIKRKTLSVMDAACLFDYY